MTLKLNTRLIDGITVVDCHGRIIFGEPNCEPLLGVTALESVGIMVDPANKTLKRLPAIPLK